MKAAAFERLLAALKVRTRTDEREYARAKDGTFGSGEGIHGAAQPKEAKGRDKAAVKAIHGAKSKLRAALEAHKTAPTDATRKALSAARVELHTARDAGAVGRPQLSPSERAAKLAPHKEKLAAAKASGDKDAEANARAALRDERIKAGSAGTDRDKVTPAELERRKTENKKMKETAEQERKAYEADSKAKEKALLTEARDSAKAVTAEETKRDRALGLELQKELPQIAELDSLASDLGETKFKDELKSVLKDGVPNGETVELPATGDFPAQTLPSYATTLPLSEALDAEGLTPKGIQGSEAWANGRIEREEMLDHAVDEDYTAGLVPDNAADWKEHVAERTAERDKGHGEIRAALSTTLSVYSSERAKYRELVRNHMRAWVASTLTEYKARAAEDAAEDDGS